MGVTAILRSIELPGCSDEKPIFPGISMPRVVAGFLGICGSFIGCSGYGLATTVQPLQYLPDSRTLRTGKNGPLSEEPAERLRQEDKNKCW
jgi:hypothetical protein